MINTKFNLLLKLSLVSLLFLMTACSKISAFEDVCVVDCGSSGPLDEEESLFEEAKLALDGLIIGHDSEVDFSLVLADSSGVFYDQSKGQSSSTTLYESASTSKLVTSVIILSLVERGVLSLDDKPQQYLDFWTNSRLDRRSQITLRHLLSFTSGLQKPEEVLCTNLPNFNFESCVKSIYQSADGLRYNPGTVYFYGTNHMQVAGMMAYKALGMNSWSEVFKDFKDRTGLFQVSEYNLPSVKNPRLAGGMLWTANEYVEFLRQLVFENLLSQALLDEMFKDHTGEGVLVVNSPATALGVKWHYGLGVWLECSSQENNSDCSDPMRFSSPGSYGAYPFIDFKQGYVGILARKGELNTFADGKKTLESLQGAIDILLLHK